MRLAILTDVHGNRFALEAVLEDIHAVTPDAVYNLGDTVWGMADPAGAWALQREHAPPTVRGNTDEFLRADPAELEAGTRAYREVLEGQLGGAPSELAVLPLTAVVGEGEVLLAHGSPADAWEALFALPEGERLARVREWPEARVVVVGHTHTEQIVSQRGVTFVNAGAVSRQKDGDPVARWVLLERRAGVWNVTFRRVPYDTEAAAQWATDHAPDGGAEAYMVRTGLRP
ncbi:metallophosphoesterase family protein [Deinococcus sp. MIMF12]|uniref:Metallophosphoesterase family protein n=1 Tax=Deinococcus rhizophilus TaxID=3049544 RepID=A0ABT7JKY4_9DEIO|nr:metallophosphoesterase family protein [Deinococcus rhizophilus]MDL2345703.1 metallophosphoesterase family protein [Deinococcus rhizophilus]